MKNSGFSLIELVVVIAILCSLLLIAGLSGKAWIERYRVEGQTKELYVDLMNARASAMQKNRTYFVTLTSQQYTIYEDRDPGHPIATDPAYDGDGVFQGAAGDAQVLQKNVNYAITPSIQINFDSRGLTGTDTTIRVADSVGAALDCIKISATRIRMGAYNASNCVVQ